MKNCTETHDLLFKRSQTNYIEKCSLIDFIIQISYSLRIPIFRLVDLYHVTLGYDETTSLTSLSWCNSRGVNLIHHCHYTMASADSKFDDFCLQCIQFE